MILGVFFASLVLTIFGQRVTLPSLQYPPSINELQFADSSKGTYFYHYDTGSQEPVSFRGERRDETGAVSGYFGYIDPEGVLRITHYVADKRGYRTATTLRYLHDKSADGNVKSNNKRKNLQSSLS